MVATRSRTGASAARSPAPSGASPSPSRPRGSVPAVPSEVKLAFAVGGIFFAFSAFAVLQEDVYRTSHGGERFRATFLVLVVERGVNTLAGAIGVLVAAWRRRRSGMTRSDRARVAVPVREILTSGVSQMLAMASSNEALRYVSFATQNLGKSCKMVPVMIGGVVAGKTYERAQYVQVLVMTLGVAAFNLGKPAAKKGGSGSGVRSDSAYGLGLVAASLAMDFVTATLQDRVKTATRRMNPGDPGARTSMFESMLWTNLGGAIAALAFSLWSGHWTEGVAFCARHAGVARAIFAYALASVVGQLFVYFTITEFDPLVLTSATTTRKIFSTALSVARDRSTKLAPAQAWGCLAVFAALGWEVVEKYAGAGNARRMRPSGGGKAKRG